MFTITKLATSFIIAFFIGNVNDIFSVFRSLVFVSKHLRTVPFELIDAGIALQLQIRKSRFVSIGYALLAGLNLLDRMGFSAFGRLSIFGVSPGFRSHGFPIFEKGKIRNTALPSTLFRLIVPKLRLSRLFSRLSPITKTCPSGTSSGYSMDIPGVIPFT